MDVGEGDGGGEKLELKSSLRPETRVERTQRRARSQERSPHQTTRDVIEYHISSPARQPRLSLHPAHIDIATSATPSPTIVPSCPAAAYDLRLSTLPARRSFLASDRLSPPITP